MSRRTNRTAEVITIAALAALFVLAGLVLLSWIAQSSAFAPPTPTPTATAAPPSTVTPDFRATHTAEDMLTQVAYSVHLATLAADTLAESQLPARTPTLTSTAAVTQAQPPPSEVSVMLPVISQADSAGATATAAAAEIANTATAVISLTAVAAAQPQSPLQTPIPTALAVATTAQLTQTVNLPLVDQGGQPTAVPPTVIPPPAPTPTPLPATPTVGPAPQPTPTATMLVINSMLAVVDRKPADVRVGPSSLYTRTTQIGLGVQVNLLGRDAAGEWIFVCCPPNATPGWIRGVSLRPTANATLPAPYSNLNQNDVRWLPIRGPEANLTPIPTSPALPPADYPMFRRDKSNAARVPLLPRTLQPGWPVGGQAGLAGGPFISGAAVIGPSVLATSSDGHLYSFDRESGNQRWRFYMGERATTTAAGDGASVYQLTDSGKLLVLDDLGNSANRRSEVNYGIQPHGGVLITHGFLVFGGRQGNNEIIVISDRNGANLRTLQVGAPPVASPAQPPVVGGQMVFAASNILQAFDLFSGEEVWRYDEANVYRSPPLYVSPGVEAAAELYVTDGQGRVLAFDANTGVLLWTTPLGAEATSLAANNTSLFATGAGFVRGLTRQRRNEGQIIWNVPIPGSMPGGPVVDDSRILVVTEGGGYQFLDAASGSPYPGGVQSPALGGAVAVSGPWVFAPTQAGTIYAARDLSQ